MIKKTNKTILTPITLPKTPVPSNAADKRGRQKNIPIEELAHLYQDKGLSHEQIGKVVGCTASNVTKRLQVAGIASLRHFKANRGDIFAATQGRILNSITDKDIKSASLLQRLTAIGILYDKERIERGLSTENISIHADIQELKALQNTNKPPPKENKPDAST